MNLKKYIQKEIRNTLLESVNEDRVNDFFYMDLKSHMWNRRKDYSNKIKKLGSLEKLQYLEDLYVKINGIEGKSSARDIKGNGIDLYKRLVKDKVIRENITVPIKVGDTVLGGKFKNKRIVVKSIGKNEKGDITINNKPLLKFRLLPKTEDEQLDQAFNDAKPVEEETKRDYKKEYAKYGKSKKAKKYRAELNKYNRQKGTYGNGDGKDASHKGGKIVGFEDESKNRGRREKSRLKKESVNEAKYYITRNLGRGQGKALVGGYDLKRDKKLPPKVFKSYKDAKKEVERLQRGGSMGGQMTAYYVTDKNMNPVKESVAPNHNGKSAPFGSGYDELKEACWKGYKAVGGKMKNGKQVPNCVPESIVKEGVMSDLHLLINKSKSEQEFVKTFFKNYGKQVKKTPDSVEWAKELYSDMKNESINEAKFYITRNLGRGQGKSLVGGYDLKRDKKLPPKVFKSYKDAQKEVERLERGGSMGGQMTAYIITDKDMNMLKPNGKKMFESSEQIDEKLITFSNRAPYGQIVFMAGGAGSGKGFAIDNFIDSAGFRVRDVDEMKKAIGKLDQLGKFSVDKWYKKYGKNLSAKPGKSGGLSPKAHVEEFVLGKGMSISDISKDLKNPNNVASLHYIVDAMGLKDKWLIAMLSGKDNKETLPNLLFDITAKKVSSITDVIKPLIANGYDSKNIHLIWVLSNFHVAIKANKDRDRMVPEDILLQTHEGAGKTMWEVMTKILPKGLNGRIDVILNKYAETVPFVDSNGKPIMVEPNQKNKLKKAQIVVKGFTSLPIKKQGGGIQPEKAWKTILKKWILDNAPKTVDLSQDLEK